MQNIDEYIQKEMSGTVERRKNSPVVGFVLLAVGGLMAGLSFGTDLSSNLRTTLMALGFIAAAVGAVWVALCLGGSLWHYHHVASRQTMCRRTVYLGLEDYNRCVSALNEGDTSVLSALSPVVSSNLAVKAVYCRHLVLVQAGRAESAEFEPATPVVALPPERLASVGWLPLK